MRTRTSGIRASLTFALAAAVLGAGALGLVAGGVALAVGAALAALALGALTDELRTERKQREAADELIERLPPQRIPTSLRWRAAELTSRGERRRVARSLRSVLGAIEGPAAVRLAPVPVNWRALRTQRRAVEELAAVLADTRRPVEPRGVVLARRLVWDFCESPIYNPRRAERLAAELARVRAALSRESR
jgi:hypothetical protein